MEILLCLLVAVVVILASFYGGIVVGISDCKRQFHIPKGVQSYFEYEDYLVNDFLSRGIFEGEQDGYNCP